MKKVLALVLTAAMLLSCMIVGISAVREITLETIEGASITASSEEASFAGELDFVKDFASRNITSYIAEFKIMASQTDFGGAPAEVTAYLAGTPTWNFGTDTIGMNGAGGSINYELVDDTWYTIKYVVNGNTTVYVNGEEVGTLSGAPAANIYGSFYRHYISYVKYTDLDGNYLWGDDFSDGVDNIFNGGVVIEIESKNAYALGSKYWLMNPGSAYIYIPEAGDYDKITFDMCYTANTGYMACQFYENGPVIDQTGIGVAGDDNLLPYNFTVDQWYHIEYIDAGDNIAVYVDDVLLGYAAVAQLAPKGICGNAEGIAFDNFTMGSKVEDFEDGSFDAFDYQGLGLVEEYDYEIEEEEPKGLFDYLGQHEAGGTALLVENSWDAEVGGYHEWNSNKFSRLGATWVIDFDLAILPTHESADGYYYELWTNFQPGPMKRWKVGIAQNGSGFAGVDADLVLFNWGESGKDNFHRVTIEFTSDGIGHLYIDEVLLYEGEAGNVATLTNMIGMNWNCDVIIDNLQVQNKKHEVVADTSDLSRHYGADYEYGKGNGKIRDINLDADDFCGENGHTIGMTNLDYDSTCYSEGQYSTYCAVCGEVKDTHVIELKHHNWSGYNINNKTDTGLVYIACKNSGCVEKRYTEIPKNYTGTLYQYYDMSDDMVMAVGTDSDPSYHSLDEWYDDTKEGMVINYVITDDGRLEHQGYTVHDEWHEVSRANIPSNNWSITFDIEFDSTKNWVNEDGGFDYEGFYIRCGGNDHMRYFVGYDRINGRVVMHKNGTNMKSDSNFYAQAPFVFEDNRVYNIKIAYEYEMAGYTFPEEDYVGQPEYCEIALYVDGEKVLSYGYRGDDFTVLTEYIGNFNCSDSTVKHFAFSQAGTYFVMDNLAFGSADYAIVKVAGDIDGDGELSAADALMMRQYLAGIITLEDFVDASVADINGDGAVNAKDQLAIRIALAA